VSDTENKPMEIIFYSINSNLIVIRRIDVTSKFNFVLEYQDMEVKFKHYKHYLKATKNHVYIGILE